MSADPRSQAVIDAHRANPPVIPRPMDPRRAARKVRDDEFRQARLDGMSSRDACAHFGISMATYRGWLKELGLPSYPSGKNAITRTHPLLEQVRELYRDHSAGQIAKLLGCTKNVVIGITERHGMRKPPAAKPPRPAKPKPVQAPKVIAAGLPDRPICRPGPIGRPAAIGTRLMMGARPPLPAGHPISAGLLGLQPWSDHE